MISFVPIKQVEWQKILIDLGVIPYLIDLAKNHPYVKERERERERVC